MFYNFTSQYHPSATQLASCTPELTQPSSGIIQHMEMALGIRNTQQGTGAVCSNEADMVMSKCLSPFAALLLLKTLMKNLKSCVYFHFAKRTFFFVTKMFSPK